MSGCGRQRGKAVWRLIGRWLALATVLFVPAVPAADLAAERLERYQRYLAFDELMPPVRIAPEWLDGGSQLRYRSGDEWVTVDVAAGTETRAPVAEGVAAAAASAPSPTFFRQMLLTPPIPFPEARSPDGRWSARVDDGDVWLRAADDGHLDRLTSNAVAGFGWDVDSARLFGVTRPLNVAPWSPDSRRLFAARVDRRDLQTSVQIDFLADKVGIERPENISFGGPLARVYPYILDVEARREIPIDVGDTSGKFLLLLGWLPDGSEVLFARASRDFRQVDVLAADAASGKARLVLSERGKNFVRIAHEFVYSGRAGFTLLPDGSGFLWESERDGWNHLYVYDLQGRLVRRLTQGAFPVLEVEAVDAGYVYLTAHAEARVYDTHLYRVPLRGGRLQRLTEGAGEHQVEFAPNRSCFIDTHSAIDRPPTVELRRADGQLVRVLHRTDTSPLEQIGWTPPEEFVAKAADGETDLWGVIYKPADFDPSARYPVIEHLYGGPQVAFVPRSFETLPYPIARTPQAFAQLGFIVVMMDTRGTPGRSKAFHDAIVSNWRVSMEDRVAVLRQLGERYAYMDMDRVGVYGHSWGGYFALLALTDFGDVYKASVSSGPGYDCNSILCEPYFAADYVAEDLAAHALFGRATQVKGDLLMIAGTHEPSLFESVMKMTRALIDAGVQHEIMVLPGEYHGYRGAALDYVIEATRRFFVDHLGAATPAAP